MTLSDTNVRSFLQKNFVSGWTDITGKVSYAGTSGTHDPDFRAVMTTNCAGHHNVQMFFLTPEGRVLHCLPGFWEPKAFLKEARLAADLYAVHRSTSLSIAEKNEKFLDLHLEHAYAHDTATREASQLQGFDAQNVEMRSESDFHRDEGFVTGCLKGADQVVHERMAERPFLMFASFDTGSFVDMGLKSFDSHNDGCMDPKHNHGGKSDKKKGAGS